MPGNACSGFYAAGWAGRALHRALRPSPCCARRHMPFPIGIQERDQWLACMDQAMGETGVDEGLRARLRDSFFQTADWMRNKAGA